MMLVWLIKWLGLKFYCEIKNFICCSDEKYVFFNLKRCIQV